MRLTRLTDRNFHQSNRTKTEILKSDNRKPVKSRLAERNIFGKILRKFWGQNSDKLTILVQDVLTIETMDHFINEFLSGSI